MTSSLIPERPILISPSLATTIGLEDAILLSVISDLIRPTAGHPHQGYDWYELQGDLLRHNMPFWNDHDIQRISQSLRAKGILLLQSEPFSHCQKLVFAFVENSLATAPRQQPASQTGVKRASEQPAQGLPIYAQGTAPIPPNWQPSDEVLARIAQHNVDLEFARQQVPEFVTFWRESGENHRSWGSKFHQHVVHKWRQRETFTAQNDQPIPMNRDWRPSQDAMDVLTRHAAISPAFVEDAIPEFLLYWSERGDVSKTWNSKFIQHVRRQWSRFNSTIEHDTSPKPIAADWQPGADVYDVLRLANIDVKFAQELLQEFIIYWRDSKQAQSSWNTKFLQHIKYHWAKRHALATSQGTNNARQATQHGRTRDRSLAEDLNDRSWAL